MLVFLFQNQYKIEFNVQNNTEFIINNLYVYSQELKKLNSKDSTSYREMNFDKLTHNLIISLIVKEKQFITYTTQPVKGRSTVSIDSLDVENRIIYYTVVSR